MTEILLSIVTPSYNQATFIAENLESVRNQAGADVEHIVVDGGSDDGTVDILREYEDTYNLRWVSESDRGQTHALNKGIEMANGEWIGWQNSDDYYVPGAFAAFRSALVENPGADAVYGDLVIVDESSERRARQFMTRPSKFIQRYWSLFASNQALFVRREILKEIYPLDESLTYTMDAELIWELLDGDYELVRVSQELGAFRVQPDAKTYQNVRPLQDEELRSIYRYPFYEKPIPDEILCWLAKALKLGYLLGDGNMEAVRANLEQRL